MLSVGCLCVHLLDALGVAWLRLLVLERVPRRDTAENRKSGLQLNGKHGLVAKLAKEGMQGYSGVQ